MRILDFHPYWPSTLHAFAVLIIKTAEINSPTACGANWSVTSPAFNRAISFVSPIRRVIRSHSKFIELALPAYIRFASDRRYAQCTEFQINMSLGLFETFAYVVAGIEVGFHGCQPKKFASKR